MQLDTEDELKTRPLCKPLDLQQQIENIDDLRINNNFKKYTNKESYNSSASNRYMTPGLYSNKQQEVDYDKLLEEI